jgi:hypothetical protein
MTPEGRVKEKVKRLLKRAGAYWHMPVQNGLGAPSLDFVGCHNGKFFAVETKAGTKQPTPRQAHTIETMQRAGAQVFVVNEVEGMPELEFWLERQGLAFVAARAA